jgi:hypothetical protein
MLHVKLAEMWLPDGRRQLFADKFTRQYRKLCSISKLLYHCMTVMPSCVIISSSQNIQGLRKWHCSNFKTPCWFCCLKCRVVKEHQAPALGKRSILENMIVSWNFALKINPPHWLLVYKWRCIPTEFLSLHLSCNTLTCLLEIIVDMYSVFFYAYYLHFNFDGVRTDIWNMRNTLQNLKYDGNSKLRYQPLH